MIFFFKNKNTLTKKESTELLETFLPYFDLPGFNALNVIETLANSDMETEKNRKICKTIVYAIVEKGLKIENVFKNVGLIQDNEYALLAKADNTKKAIENILDIRKISWKAEIEILKTFWFYWLLIFATMGMIGFGFPLLVELLQKQVVQINNKVNIADTLPWFIDYALLFKILTILTLIAPILLFILYLYLYFKNTKLLYKIFPLKAYDDLPRYFTLMISLRNTGFTLREIMNELYQYPYPKPISELWYYVSNNDNLGKGFRLFNMPDDITKIIIRFTEANKIYEVLPNLKELSIKRFNTLVKRINIVGGMVGKLTWFLPIYFLTKVVMWVITLFTSITSGIGY